jgi:hypothetical protein
MTIQRFSIKKPKLNDKRIVWGDDGNMCFYSDHLAEADRLKQENEYLIKELESSGIGWTRDQIPNPYLESEE